MAWGVGDEMYHERIAWTPTLQGAITNPSGWTRVNSHTHYQVIGSLVICKFKFKGSGSATYGSGVWSLPLPVTAASKSFGYSNLGTAIFWSDLNRSDGVFDYFQTGFVCQSGTSSVMFLDANLALILWGYGSDYKFTGGSPDSSSVFSGEFFYEAAV